MEQPETPSIDGDLAGPTVFRVLGIGLAAVILGILFIADRFLGFSPWLLHHWKLVGGICLATIVVLFCLGRFVVNKRGREAL